MIGCGAPLRLDARGIGVRARIWGLRGSAGTPVVLLHGFAGSADDWAESAPALAATGRFVVAVDLPGHGEADLPHEPSRYSMAETLRDLSVVTKNLGIHAAHWAGYSMGGRVALHFALSHPDRVTSLILESATPGIEDPRARAERRSRDEVMAEEIAARGVPWFVAHWESEAVFASQRFLPHDRLLEQRARRLRNRAAGLCGSLRGIGQGVLEDAWPKLPSLATPVLALAGEQDPTYAAHAERIAKSVPDGAFEIVPGAGHNVHLERPEAFTRVLLGRLRRLESETRARASIPTK